MPPRLPDGLPYTVCHTLDGLIYTDFIAKEIKYCNKTGFKINKLREGTGHLINFAISGATSNNNVPAFINNLSGSGLSYEAQVDHFLLLLSKSNVIITERDIFGYVTVGDNDSFLTFLLAASLPPLEIPAFIEQRVELFANITVANIDKLYQKGCRRLFLQVASPSLVNKIGIFLKLETFFPGTIPRVTSIIAAQESKLNEALEAAKPGWPGLEITRYSDEILDEFFTNPQLYGIATPVLSFNPPLGLPLNNQSDTGAWPVDEPLPTSNAKNLLFIDDSIHYTQHSAKQFSKFMLNYITPL